MNFLQYLMYTFFLALMATEFRHADTYQSQLLVAMIFFALLSGWLWYSRILWEERDRGDED